MSIRLRLTLIYTGFLAFTMILFSVTLYMGQTHAGAGFMREMLANQTEYLTEQWPIDIEANALVLRGGPSWQKELTIETYAQLRNTEGEVLQQSRNMQNGILPLGESAWDSALNGQPKFAYITIDDELFLLYNYPIINPNNELVVLQTARSLEFHERYTGYLFNILVLANVVILTFALAMGWGISGMMLRPIDRITQTAQAIGRERNFSHRVDYHGPPDEIGQLATTFNVMLTELQTAYQQVEESLQRQQQFTSDASHELRTPLTTIRGNLVLLQRQPPISEEDREDILVDLVDEAERLTRLVQDLLTLARADEKVALPQKRLSLSTIVEDACRQTQSIASQKIHYEHRTDYSICGSHDALKQILLILLDNAVKHTPPSTKIKLSTTSNDDKVMLTIKDNGPGIPSDKLPHIFDRFYRGDNARSSGGSGLGLAIAKELTEAQHGTLAVESVIGKGTSFHITLKKS